MVRRFRRNRGRHDATRAIRGIAFGCALSLPLWAAIGLAVHAALG